MTEETALQILEKLNELGAKIDLIMSQPTNKRAMEFEALPGGAVVRKDYVAYRFGCSEGSVLRGRSGTNKIRRVSSKPLKFIKREVDAAWLEYSKSNKEKALEFSAKARSVGRKTVTRKAA